MLLLSDGILSNAKAVAQLRKVLHRNLKHGQESISVIYDDSSWHFGCAAQENAAPDVKSCLETYEALTYRPKDRTEKGDHWLRHEFPAMVAKLLLNLGVFHRDPLRGPDDSTKASARADVGDRGPSGERSETACSAVAPPILVPPPKVRPGTPPGRPPVPAVSFAASQRPLAAGVAPRPARLSLRPPEPLTRP